MHRTIYLLAFMFSYLLNASLEGVIYDTETPVLHYLRDVSQTPAASGMELIDSIFVINLDHRVDKWSRIANLLHCHHLYPSRVSGINGWLFSNEQRQELMGNYPLRMTGGQIGCVLSHVSTVKAAYDRGLEVVWIMEDDIDIVDDVAIIPELMKELTEIDPNWDILYTDMNSKNREGEFVYSLGSDFRPDREHESLSYYTERVPVSKNIEKIHQRFGAYSYIVSRKGLEKILHYFTHVYLWTSYDIDMHYIPGIREYCPSREIVTINYEILISDTTRPSG